MTEDPLRKLAACRKRARRLEERWRRLCAGHLPAAPADSIWRYSHEGDSQGPAQGWKLHVSATVLNACEVLERVGPLLTSRRVGYKAPRSLAELFKLNSGIYFGYTQVGKVFTVYPRTDAEAVELAERLCELTRRLPAPAVPFDRRFGGNVYYRFGAFARVEMEREDGRRSLAVRGPGGALVPDVRDSADAKPDWVTDPFLGALPRAKRSKSRTRLAQSFHVFRALVQRGKGGVYQAAHLGAGEPRLCLLKEGRRHGEVRWDGRDAARMVRHEEAVLSSLRARGLDAPRIYSSFEMDGNYYLVTEFIEGESLHNLLARRERRMPVPAALRYGVQLSDIFRRLHAAGWVWRDCKPANILVTPAGRLRPIDFEGACPADEPDPLFWGTPGFTPPEWHEPNRRTCASGDLYALGAMLYLLLTGMLPGENDPVPVERLRRGVPPEVGALVTRLLDRNPDARPPAEVVSRSLQTAPPARARRPGARARAPH
jgi:serine/threonine protein kinase